ncbi:unnamed protein product [Chrysoparadoxa australica]
MFLGELIFSTNDPRDDIVKRLDQATDEDFRTWLTDKANASTDLDERAALKGLSDMIDGVVAKLEEQDMLAPMVVDTEAAPVEAEAEPVVSAPMGAGEPLRSNEEVFGEMRRLQGLEPEGEAEVVEKGSVFETVPEKVRQGYEQVLRAILERPADTSLLDAVDANYDKCDLQFLTLVKQKVKTAEFEEAQKLQEVLDGVNTIMSQRMSKATERLQAILQSGTPPKMEAKIVEMAGKGEIDDALLLLMEGNIQQAVAAGAAGPEQLLRKLMSKAQSEMDNKMEPEKKLLRQLMRTDDSETRKELLKEAFRPRAKLMLSEGQETSEEPNVLPPAFLNAIKQLKLNFGNIGEVDPAFAAKIQDVMNEAELIATELYGESVSARDQQDKAWNDASVSVWDLEKIEDQALISGEEAPWANDKYDDIMPNFGKTGRWDIGGDNAGAGQV